MGFLTVKRSTRSQQVAMESGIGLRMRFPMGEGEGTSSKNDHEVAGPADKSRTKMWVRTKRLTMLMMGPSQDMEGLNAEK